MFTISFVILGWLGMQVATPNVTMASRIFTVIYFLFFLLMPFYTANETDKSVPDRVT